MKEIERLIITASTTSLGVLAYFIYDNNRLTISKVEINSPKIPKEFRNFKILQLTDLHGKIFGKNNIRLLNKIKEINPDIVIATGDMFSINIDKKEVFLNLCKEIRKYYPVYYSLGNHEVSLRDSTEYSKRDWYVKYISKIKESGITLIDNYKVSLLKQGSKINLYGITLPIKYYRRRLSKDRRIKNSLTKEFMDKQIGQANLNEFNILLAHNPLNFRTYLQWGSDLTFSGHVHGGIVRLPFIKGILSPEVSFLPKYKEGLYKDKNAFLVVGRGLGNSSIKFRIFNPPEIIVALLK